MKFQENTLNALQVIKRKPFCDIQTDNQGKKQYVHPFQGVWGCEGGGGWVDHILQKKYAFKKLKHRFFRMMHHWKLKDVQMIYTLETVS